ncbi:MAG: hypothetical protein LBU34_14195 [Planctomycetaceae bacterium]|nr:hypothetical protein [Planctomycetaceae bacterium]
MGENPSASGCLPLELFNQEVGNISPKGCVGVSRLGKFVGGRQLKQKRPQLSALN